MTSIRHWPLGVRVLLLLLAATVAITLYVTLTSNAGAATTAPTMTMQTTTMQMPTTPAPTSATLHKLAFRRAMDKLWEDHVTWTRMVIVSFFAGSPDLQAAETRLLQNQVDIGDAVKPFYGTAAGDQLTALLRTHILEAVTVLQAAKAGDQTALAAAQQAWLENADQIALFLHNANPRFWPLADLQTMMHEHLQLTTAEAVARLTGDWNGDVVAYDNVHNEILSMSNMLASGIIRQFPQRFAR